MQKKRKAKERILRAIAHILSFLRVVDRIMLRRPNEMKAWWRETATDRYYLAWLQKHNLATTNITYDWECVDAATGGKSRRGV